MVTCYASQKTSNYLNAKKVDKPDWKKNGIKMEISAERLENKGEEITQKIKAKNQKWKKSREKKMSDQ